MREADPNELRLPPSRHGGVDLWKLHRQMRKFGSGKTGMPPIFVYEDPDGILEIFDVLPVPCESLDWRLA